MERVLENEGIFCKKNERSNEHKKYEVNRYS